MSQTAQLEARPAPAPGKPLTPLARPVVQRRAVAASAAESAPESVHRALASPGRPLDAGTRGFMESRFGHDFSQVRIHTDSVAADSARAINAHAYTFGQDIAFAPGKYQPDSHSGRHLLAHELAHTIQQGGLQRRASDLAVDTAPQSPLEHEAESAARSVVAGGGRPIVASRPPSAAISRAKGEITTEEINGKKAKKVRTEAGFTHNVTPTGAAALETDNKGNTTDLAEFSVDTFFLPPEKGPGAFSIYEGMASGGGLEATLSLTGSGRTKTALWQERPDTDDLRDIWLQKIGWTGQDSKTVNDLWQRAGGDKEFPKVNGETAQMDHTVELQIGGNNTPENIQPLDAEPNGKSGRDIKKQLQTLAVAIAEDSKLASGDPAQIKMRFQGVKQLGKPAALRKPPFPKGKRSALEVEAAAKGLKVSKGADGALSIAREAYPISAGGRPPTNLSVPSTFATAPDEKVPIAGDAMNDPASTLIPGLRLITLCHEGKGKKKVDRIEAAIDDRDKTRLPITLDAKTKNFALDVANDGALSLPKNLKKTAIGFTYKYLSPGVIESVTMNGDGGIDWTGKVKPTAKFIPTLDVKYQNGVLSLVAQVPEEKLKKAKLFGAKITRASLDIVLSPTFDVTGNLEFVFGNESKPAATGKLTLGKDDQGLVGTAKLQLHIPKIDASEITFEYKGGADREEWSGELRIETAQIKLPYVSGGSIVAKVSSKGGVTELSFEGKISLELPGKRGTAQVSLRRWGNQWALAGLARLDLPRIDDFSAGITYDIDDERLTVTVPGEDGKTPAKPIGFKLTEDFQGTMERLKLVIGKGGGAKLSGAGGFKFKKGKASGFVRVEIDEKDSSFNGTGDIAYQLSDNITVDGKVEFKEKGMPKLRISGALTFKRLELMRQISDKATIFEKSFSIPIPGASIGGVGLNAFFEVKLEGSYSLGAIVVEPLIFTAGFNPLDDEPQLDLGASGELKVPAEVSLSASLSGGVKIDAFIAEVGGKITITGTIKLKGGLFVPFKGSYSNKEFSVEMTPEAKLNLILGVLLTATVWAKAGIGWLSVKTEKTWELARREVDTKLGFGIKAPISYNSRTGAKFPSASDITFVPPDFSSDNLERIARELFSGAKEGEREV